MRPKPGIETPQAVLDQPGAERLSDDAVEGLRRQAVHAVLQVCPPPLADQVEDLAQAVLMKLVEATQAGGAARSFSSIYVAKAAHGFVVDEIRRLKRRREESLTDLARAERLPDSRPTPEAEAYACEILRGLCDALRKIARSRRLAVILWLQGWGVPDVARCLGWTEKRAENLVYRGLAELRGRLRLKGIEP